MKKRIISITGIMLGLFCLGSCDLFQQDEKESADTFPTPVEIFAVNVYEDQLIGANSVNAYVFEAPGSYNTFRVEVSHLTTNCDLEVYEYDSSSDVYEDQELLGYSKQSLKVDETVTLSVETGVQYLIIVEEKDGKSGSFWVYAGI